MKHTLIFFFITFLVTVESETNGTTVYSHGSASKLTSSCTAIVCNNGYCNQTAQGPVCICDEGVTGTYCNQQGSDFYHRTLLVPYLADPFVLALNDDLFYLMGTANGLVLPIYQSTDLINFPLKTIYNPSAADAANDYCYLWAPNLLRNGNGFDLYFVAIYVAKNTTCVLVGRDVSIFLAQASDDKLSFGKPVLVNFGSGAPSGRAAAGCNNNNCMKTLRIDPDLAGLTTDRWFFYVWFEGGNNIASFPLSAPSNVVANAGPVVYQLGSNEQSVNEAPEVFYRNGQFYLFFSTGVFTQQYAMSYIMSRSIADLTRNRVVRTHSIAQRNSAGNLVQSHGSNVIVSRRGQFFNVFHQGIFDTTGNMIARSTFKQRIAFRSDGSIQTLTTIDIRWNQLPSYQYSLDVITRNGTWISSCFAANRIGSTLGITYMGICPDSGDQLIDKGDIATFRLFYSNDGNFANYVESAYDGVSDQLAIHLPDGTTQQIVIRWTERMTGAKYSLNVARSNGGWIAPCVGNNSLVHNITYVFDGNCSASSVFVDPQDVIAIRVCSAVNDDWSNAVCSSTAYDGKSIFLYINLPSGGGIALSTVLFSSPSSFFLLFSLSIVFLLSCV